MTEIEILAGRFGKNADSIGAVAPVTVTTSTTEIVGANVSRAYIIIQNQGIVPVFLNLGADASATAYNYVLSAGTGAKDGLGGSVKIEGYTGAIDGITASSTADVSIMEIDGSL
jgi:hypothetical protein